jgi:predicted  nucleic acid-binding Zn-ribbon protein
MAKPRKEDKMETIKDLNLLISEAERMRKSFVAFQRLPDILKEIQASKKLPEEIKKQVAEKQVTLNDLKIQITAKTTRLKSIDAKIGKADEKWSSIEDDLNKKRTAILTEINEEAIEAKNIASDEIKGFNKGLKEKRAAAKLNFEKTMEGYEKKIETIQAKIKQAETEESDAIKRKDNALKSLEKVKKAIMGGGA